MDRKQKLATAGAISLTATAAVVALGASVGLFGLTDDSPRVGKLSPIDSTQTTTATTPDDIQTIIIEDPAPAAPNGAVGTVTPRLAGPSSATTTATTTSPRRRPPATPCRRPTTMTTTTTTTELRIRAPATRTTTTTTPDSDSTSSGHDDDDD